MTQTEKLEYKLEQLTELRNQYADCGDYHQCNKISLDLWDIRERLEIHRKLDKMIVDAVSTLHEYKN